MKLQDDESDLELEIEAVPAASSEVLSEDAACVRVLSSEFVFSCSSRIYDA